MQASERQTRVVALLEDNVRREIRMQNQVNELGLSDHAVEHLMEAITAEILYAFDVDWAPDWVRPGGVHTWKDPEGWFGRCSSCLLDSPPMPTKEEAVSWAHDHERACSPGPDPD